MEGFLAFAATHCATLCSKLRTLLSLGQPPEKRWSDAVPCISRATFRTVHVPCFALCLIVGAAGALFGGLGIAQHNDRYSFPADNCTVANSIVIDDACSCSVPHKDQGREANKCRVPSCNDVSPCLQITAQSSALPSPTPLYLHIWALGLSDRCIYGQPPSLDQNPWAAAGGGRSRHDMCTAFLDEVTCDGGASPAADRHIFPTYQAGQLYLSGLRSNEFAPGKDFPCFVSQMEGAILLSVLPPDAWVLPPLGASALILVAGMLILCFGLTFCTDCTCCGCGYNPQAAARASSPSAAV